MVAVFGKVQFEALSSSAMAFFSVAKRSARWRRGCGRMSTFPRRVSPSFSSRQIESSHRVIVRRSSPKPSRLDLEHGSAHLLSSQRYFNGQQKYCAGEIGNLKPCQKKNDDAATYEADRKSLFRKSFSRVLEALIKAMYEAGAYARSEFSVYGHTR